MKALDSGERLKVNKKAAKLLGYGVRDYGGNVIYGDGKFMLKWDHTAVLDKTDLIENTGESNCIFDLFVNDSLLMKTTDLLLKVNTIPPNSCLISNLKETMLEAVLNVLSPKEDDRSMIPCPWCGRPPETRRPIPVIEHNSSFPETAHCTTCKVGFYGHGAKDKWNNRFPYTKDENNEYS